MRGLFTLRAPRGVMWGTRFSALSTTSCVWSRFIARAVGSCNAVGHMWVGGIPLPRDGRSAQKCILFVRATPLQVAKGQMCDFLKLHGFGTNGMWRGWLHYGWIAVEVSSRITGHEEVGCIMAGSWQRWVVELQDVKRWAALWLDSGRGE